MNDHFQYRINAGYVSIIIRKQACDWYIAHLYTDTPYTSATIIREKALADDDMALQPFRQQRWMTGCTYRSFGLYPVFPERPFIIYPDIPTRIPQNSVSTFFMKIPVWISITAGNDEPGDTGAGKPDDKSVVLCELPVVSLSNSWSGDTVSGELCYALNSGMSKNFHGLDAADYHAICPVTIENSSRSDFIFERYALHAEYLSVLQGQQFLWTNPVGITFLGEDQHSKMQISEEYPAVEEITGKLSEAKNKIEKNIVIKTFRFFRTLRNF